MITLITGPMKCGKSTELFRQMERKHIAGKKILYISAKNDSREFFARGIPRSKLFEVANVKVVENWAKLGIKDIQKMIDDYDAIFIDEFFMIKNNYVLPTFMPINPDHKCDIYFAGLIADAKAQLFPEAIKVIPLCDEIIKLSAVCEECGSEHANFSYMKNFKCKPGTFIVGDAEYRVLCRKCYFKAFRQEGNNE